MLRQSAALTVLAAQPGISATQQSSKPDKHGFHFGGL